MLSVELLRQQKLLAGLDDALLADLGRSMQLKEYERRELVVQRDSPGEDLLMLVSGRLQVVVRADDGREIGLSFIEPNDYFGEMSIVDGAPRSASVVALEPSKVALLPRTPARQLIFNHPMVVERLMRRFCEMIRANSAQRQVLAVHNALARVAAVLAANLPEAGSATRRRLPTQQNLANMANVSRETVSRSIHKLLERGVLRREQRQLVVADPQALRALAATDRAQQREADTRPASPGREPRSATSGADK